MRISIHQPAYLPWLGYIEKLQNCDIFVVLDHVQFQNSSFQNRNFIKSKNKKLLLTVPVIKHGYDGLPTLNRLQINNQTNWQRKHWKSIEQNYSKCDQFSSLSGRLQKFYLKKYDALHELCKEMLEYYCEIFKIKTRIVYSKELGCWHKSGSELLLDICKHLHASEYYSGTLGRRYLNLEDFRASGIEVVFQDYQVKQYAQKGENFLENMSVIDLLFNENQPKLYV